MKTKLALALFIFSSAFALAQTTVDDILERVVDSQRGGETSHMVIEMQVSRPEGDKVYVMESVSDGDKRGLTKVLEPSKDAGQAFLQDGESLYIYNPRLKRVLRMPPSRGNESFLGSDLNYNDITGRDLEENYEAEITAEDDNTVELTLIPGELAPTPYGKVVLVADKQNNYAPLTYTFFDQRGDAVRQMRFSDYQQVGELYMPTHFEIENLLKTGEMTVINFKDLRFGVDVNEACFSQTALERGCD
ncbi:MAG: outer membrane lipoprotein-sorting protein [Deinococcales bacterium]